MGRFHASEERLNEDLAYQAYVRQAKRDPSGFDPAEWILALHKEHWETLEELKQAKAETAGERVAKIMADLHLVSQSTGGWNRRAADAVQTLEEVLGQTDLVLELQAVVSGLKEARLQLVDILEDAQ